MEDETGVRWWRTGREEEASEEGRELILLLFSGDEEDDEEEAVMTREDIHLGECMGTGPVIGARNACPRISTSPLSTWIPMLPTKQQDSPACLKKMGHR